MCTGKGRLWRTNLLPEPEEPIPDLAQYLFEKTGGFVAFLSILRREATRFAVITGSRRVMREHIDSAMGLMYRALKGQAPGLSPMVRAHPLLRTHPSTWGADSSGAEAQARLRAMLSEWESPSVDELGARLGSSWIWRSDPVRGRSVDASPFFVQAAVVSAELQRLAM